jgi:N-acetylglucosaminyl-diphospho-decaprenol L-rhamnosyltransferase
MQFRFPWVTRMLLIVIVNYRTPQLTIDCLASLTGEVDKQNARVVVTDNASGDDSVERITAAIEQQGWSGWVDVMPLAENGGFAYGNNAAIRPTLSDADGPDLVWLLNPDTVVRPGALQALVDCLSANPNAGIVGSRLEDPDGTPQRSAFRLPSVTGEFESAVRLGLISRLVAHRLTAPPASTAVESVDWVAGASMLIRREVFADVGLLDEGYFMYFEELDFCHRAANAGWQCWYAPASRVVHLVGQASGVTGRQIAPKRRPSYWFDSRRRYLLTHHGRFKAALFDLAWIIGHACWWLRATLTGKPKGDPPRIWLDFIGQSTLLRGSCR